jgi:nucleotide-binding universal stress UspA family protein
MYTNILVPLDGSELAEQVLPHVEALAEKFKSAITLLRVIVPSTAAIAPAPMDLPMTPPMAPYTVSDLAETIEIERQAAAEYLQSVAERLRSTGLQVTYERQEGPIASVIIERANTLGADLIAMTTHGRSGLERVILGSVADEVIRKSNCPVLMVRTSESVITK